MKILNSILLIALFFNSFIALAAYENKDIANQSNPDVNIVVNNGCENGKQGWIEAGAGTLSTTSTASEVYDGKTSCVWNPSAAAATVKSAEKLIPNRLAGVHGVPSLWYFGAGGADITVRLRDADGDIVPSFEPVVITDAVTNWTEIELSGVYPALAATTNDRTLYIEMESSGDANPIRYDLVWIGTKSIGQAPHKEKLGDIGMSIAFGTSAWTVTSEAVRDGEHLEVYWDAELTNVTGIAGNLLVQLPASLHPDLTNMPGLGSAGSSTAGWCRFQDTGSTNRHKCSPQPYGAPLNGEVNAFWLMQTSTGDQEDFSTPTAPFIFANGDKISGFLRVRIIEWLGQGTVHLFNNSMAKANYELEIENNSGGFIPTSYTEWDGELVTGTNVPDYNVATDIWTPSFTGRVSVMVSVGTGSGTGALRFAINRDSGVLTTSAAITEHTGDTRTVAKTFEFDVTEGEEIRFWNMNGVASQNYLTTGDWNKILITRKQEFNVTSSLGFKPLADATNAGLVGTFNAATKDLGSGNTSLGFTGISNVDSGVSFTCHYLRVGNFILVGFEGSINTTAAATLTEFNLDVPIASNFTTVDDANGSASLYNIATDNDSAHIEADAANDKVKIKYISNNTGTVVISGTFTYIVK